MRIPFSWLKEFAPVPAPAVEVAQKLRQVGVPVVKVEVLAEGITQVYSGKIAALEPHPNADKLRVAQVDLGNETVQIVTGAKNVSQGDIIPVAKIGAVLAGGKKIAEAKLRGTPSHGMMCSAQELSLDLKDYFPVDQREGVLILDPATPLGIDLSSMLGLNEAVFVLEPFANRPDYLSVFGVAREAAAIYGVPLNVPVLHSAGQGSLKDKISISVMDSEGCSRYTARLVSNVEVKPSPLWMAVRLYAAGIRPINNIVDVTNTVLLELGQPLHAFDFAELRGKQLEIRRAREGEKLVGIDGKPYLLTGDMLTISDGKGPVALAGILGGKESEISEGTKEVVLEAAHFTSSLIRRTSLKLGVRTESSRRFEKGLDPVGAEWGSRRACALFQQLGCTVSESFFDSLQKGPEPTEISLSLAGLKSVLGVEDVVPEHVDKVLSGLGFTVHNRNPWLVEPPVFRGDLREEIDVVEDIARHYGYERIPVKLPQGATVIAWRDSGAVFEARLREFFKNSGMNEVVTYSLGDPGYFKRFYTGPLGLVRNPLTEDRKALRPLLYPEMLLCLKRNFNLKMKDLALFEIGRVFQPHGEIREKRHFALLLTGKFPWGGPISFFTLKGVLEHLWQELHADVPFVLQEGSDPAFHPLRFAMVQAGKKGLGFLGELHPVLLQSLGLEALEQKVAVLELALDPLQSLQKEAKLKAIPVYPESRRDVSMIVDEKIPAGRIQDQIRKAGGKLVEEVRVFDVYQGSQVPETKKSVALAVVYRSLGKTLTDEEVNAVHSKILAELEQNFKASLRIS